VGNGRSNTKQNIRMLKGEAQGYGNGKGEGEKRKERSLIRER
jgi:hypothetical protein